MPLPEPFGRRLKTPGRSLHDLDREFREWPVFAGWPFQPRLATQWSPRIEVFEHGNAVVVRAEVPGLTADDIRLTLDKDGLLIEGEFSDQREETAGSYYVCEREYGHFSRRVPLAVDVEVERAQINVAHGLLTVRIPRRTPSTE